MKLGSRKNWMKLVVVSGLTLHLWACGTAPNADQSSIKVTNGREIKDTDYPSVVFIASEVPDGVASCTATFVNDSQVVSAAHCVEGTSSSSPAIYLVKQTIVNGQPQLTALAKAVKWVRNPSYNFDDGVNNLDISVITFPENSAPATSTITKAVPKSGDELTIVGYGNNRNYIDGSGEFTGSGAGKKRVGTNTVAAVTDGMIQFIGAPEASSDLTLGDYALSGSGDSGGPLFINGRLAGVTSGGGVSRTQDGQKVFVSQYVDLTSAESQSVLKRALKAGTL